MSGWLKLLLVLLLSVVRSDGVVPCGPSWVAEHLAVELDVAGILVLGGLAPEDERPMGRYCGLRPPESPAFNLVIQLGGLAEVGVDAVILEWPRPFCE